MKCPDCNTKMDLSKKIREILEELTDSYDYATDTGGTYDYDQAEKEIKELVIGLLEERAEEDKNVNL